MDKKIAYPYITALCSIAIAWLRSTTMKAVYWLAVRLVSPRLSWAWPSACCFSLPVTEPTRFCGTGTRVSEKLVLYSDQIATL